MKSSLAFDLSPASAPWRYRDTHAAIYQAWLASNPAASEYVPLSDDLFLKLQPKKRVFYNPYERFASFADYERNLLYKSVRSCRLERRLYLADKRISQAQQTSGFKVRKYNSGEMSGAMFTTGLTGKIIPAVRSGAVETFGFTVPARNKIRRAVENSELPLQYFLTLTFAPASCQPWQKDSVGNIRHDFAKFRLHRFLDALSKHVKRRYSEELSYVWVAELQKNGNIHFHILLNKRLPIAYYRKLWTVGNTDIQHIQDSNHAVNYMRKYMTKEDNSLIKGNRYGICAALRKTMKPLEEIITSRINSEPVKDEKNHVDVLNLIQAMRSEIEFGGGTVLDFGFSIPRPRRERFYIDKKTKERKKTKGVHRKLADNVYQLITGDLSD